MLITVWFYFVFPQTITKCWQQDSQQPPLFARFLHHKRPCNNTRIIFQWLGNLRQQKTVDDTSWIRNGCHNGSDSTKHRNYKQKRQTTNTTRLIIFHIINKQLYNILRHSSYPQRLPSYIFQFVGYKDHQCFVINSHRQVSHHNSPTHCTTTLQCTAPHMSPPWINWYQ